MAQEGRSILAYIFRNFINSLRPRRISGDLVGKDYYGNKFYEIPPNPKIGKRKATRWFVPQTTDKYDFIHEVSPEWEAWLRGRRTEPPTQEELKKNLEIMKLKQENALEIERNQSASKQDVVGKEIKGMESFPKYDEYEVMPDNQNQMAESEELSIIQTKYTALNKNESAINDFQVVVHHHKRKKADRKSSEDNIEHSRMPVTQKNEIDIKKARYEVLKFAMSGLKPDQKQEAKAALAIQLGAKPPRNKCYNYKEYKQMKEKQREEQLQQQNLLTIGKNQSGKPVFKGSKKTRRRKLKVKKGGILDPYGKPGKVQLSAEKKKK